MILTSARVQARDVTGHVLGCYRACHVGLIKLWRLLSKALQTILRYLVGSLLVEISIHSLDIN